MGALHAGHLSLINGRDKKMQQSLLVSLLILCNLDQRRLSTLPHVRPRSATLNRQGGGCNFAPAEEMGWEGWEVYPTPYLYSLPCTQVVPICYDLSSVWSPRPGHFQGVATIVTKLLNLVQPERAYFGQKDAQQLAIIQRLVKDLNLPVKLLPVQLCAEASGLTLSSRNQYLTD